MNQGAVHEAMNFASAFNLPVVFICENNKYSELTPIAEMVRSDRLYERAAAYRMPGERVDGNDPLAVEEVVSRACRLAREGGGPTLVEAMTQRLVGHYIGDAEQYRPAGEVEELRKVEPLTQARTRLEKAGVTILELDRLIQEARQEIEEAAATALKAPKADPILVKEHLYGRG
jgi:pyruvate dehydrogenase E1 component alpha subunit